MSNDNYSKEAQATYLMWEVDIKAAEKMRVDFPPQLLPHEGNKLCKGYNDHCKACGTKIYAEFGDYGRPLMEQFVPCSISDGPGHGIWASGINIITN